MKKRMGCMHNNPSFLNSLALKTRLFFFLFILLGINPRLSWAQGPVQKIPSFSFLRYNKAPFTEKDIHHDKLALVVFVEPDCEHCQYAISKVNQDFNRFKTVNLYIVSVEGEEKMNYFIHKYAPKLEGQSNITLLEDRFHQFILKFIPKKYPSFYLFSKDGNLIEFEDDARMVPKLEKNLPKS